jgi:hypothetical protein
MTIDIAEPADRSIVESAWCPIWLATAARPSGLTSGICVHGLSGARSLASRY